MTEPGTTLGTYRGILCHHWDEELPLIARVLETYRPRLVVEVGTMYGGFAAFLADTVAPWQGEVLTIDHVLYEGIDEVCKDRPNLFFLRGDVFSPFVSSVVRRALASGDHENTCLYCDAGPKRLELEAFGASASLVGVHDYGTEITVEKAEAWVKANWVVPVEEEAFAALQAKRSYFVSRFWRRSP